MEYWDMKLLLEGGGGGEGWWAEIRNVEFGLLFALKCQHHTCENNQWVPSARAPPGTFQLSLHMQHSAPLCNTTPSTRLRWFCSKRIGFEGRWPASGSYVRCEMSGFDLFEPQFAFYAKRENVTISQNYCFGSVRYRIWRKCSVW